jgi:putative tricarboxylic transport membrane protein
VRRDRRRAPRERLNVRGQLVGPEEAERIDVDDDRRTALATMALGALMLVMAVVVAVQAARLDNEGELVGPATAPWLVGVLLMVTAVLMIVRGRRDMGVWEYSDHPTGQDWARLAALLGTLVGFALLMPLLGYVVSATALFGTAAIVLGAPHRLRSFAYGWCVAVLVFLIFDVGIGIALPTGPWGF